MFMLLFVCITLKKEKVAIKKKLPKGSNCSDLKITDFQGVSKEKTSLSLYE